MNQTPILYSFRRCPYAMRARLAIAASNTQVELREVVLRNKPPSLLAASPKATVPVLITLDGTVLQESLELMFWALEKKDPHGWLAPWQTDKPALMAFLAQADGPFKAALDRYKYPPRYTDENTSREEQRALGLLIIKEWDQRLEATGWLFGTNPSLADMAVLPFLRQYAHVDKTWFDQQSLPHAQRWLENFLASDTFNRIMNKYAPWQENTPGMVFPPSDSSE